MTFNLVNILSGTNKEKETRMKESDWLWVKEFFNTQYKNRKKSPPSYLRRDDKVELVFTFISGLLKLSNKILEV